MMITTPNNSSHVKDFHSTLWEQDLALQDAIEENLTNDQIQAALIKAFNLDPQDAFKYWAHIPVTLAELQHVVNLDDVNGLHHWYSPDPSLSAPSAESGSHEKPSRKDIDAYIAIFNPSLSAPSQLRAFESEAKANSIRKRAASHLSSKRHLDSNIFTIPRRKQPHWNPGLRLWSWYCRSAEWAGPVSQSGLRHVNHPALPVMMHHFGCVVPTYEALEIIRTVTNNGQRPVIEIGSGNGYWAYMLRRAGMTVHAVDSGQSVFRTNWIEDTIKADALRYLAQNKGGAEAVLLMVYPVVSGDFTRKVLDAYKGEDVVVAGTQNGNGYTGFKDMTMDEYMESERAEWTRTAQVPLPSYPGKDEALYVFTKRQVETKAIGEDTTDAVPMGEGKNAKANARKKAKKKAKAAAQASDDQGAELESGE